MLDADFGRAAEIEHAPARERNEIARATGRFRPLAELRTAVVGPVGLRPADQAFQLGSIESGREGLMACRGMSST
ncbi:hypothetical protein A9O63_07880 [Cereibacter johrii]|nr:hypothetical protein A9O63_07880 [Cereibacter johrii]